MAKIQYADKVDRRTIAVAPENKVVAANMNEIKASVNALYDMLENIRQRIQVSITSANFSGNNYDNTNLVGLSITDFMVFSNDGSGVLLNNNALAAGGSFTFSSGQGRLVMSPGNYTLVIFKPLI